LVVASPAVVFAQAEDEPFRRGLVARGEKRWAQAVEAMRRAISINRMESTRKIQNRSILFFGSGTEYLPHYFLGEALKNVGDCTGAVTAWETSEEQKIVLKVPEFADLLRAGYKECAAKGVLLRDEYRQQVSATDQVYNEALAVATRLDPVRSTNPDLWVPDVEAEFERARNELGAAQRALVKGRQTRQSADFTESRNASARAAAALRPLETKLGAALNARAVIRQQTAETQQILTDAETTDGNVDAAKIALPPDLAKARESARALVTRSRERLAAAEKTQNQTAANEALRLAREASEAVGQLLEQVNKLARADFEQRLQHIVAAATEQFSFVATSLATLERLVAEKPATMSPAMAGEREALLKEQSALQRRLENARRTENLAGIQDAMRRALDSRGRIDALIKAFGPATLRDRGVLAPLEEGARLYFAGEYQQALDRLEPLMTMKDVPLQLHAHLFRAAALYALYIRSGESTQSLRNDALAAIQRCREIDSAFQPDARAFSPRFISFFQGAGASDAPSAGGAIPR
jgi:hypothetical protein